MGVRFVAALLAAVLASRPGLAADVPVDVALVLAVDASRSIDDEEWNLQRQGYIDALNDPQVIEAIQSGAVGAIALTYVEWSSDDEQETVVGWRLIRDLESAAEFTHALAGGKRRFMSSTSISGAVDYAVRLFDGNGFEGLRRTIDISGDGANNRGRSVDAARDDAVAAGVTINALAILDGTASRNGYPEPPVDEFMRDHVIGGPGAFMIVVKGFDSFREAIRRKLIQEIVGIGDWRYALASPY